MNIVILKTTEDSKINILPQQAVWYTRLTYRLECPHIRLLPVLSPGTQAVLSVQLPIDQHPGRQQVTSEAPKPTPPM